MLRALLRSVLGVLVLLQISVGGAFAESVSFPELTDPLPGKMDTTYADLVRLVVPSAAGGTQFGDRAIKVRHIDGGDGTDIAPASAEVRYFAAVPVRSGGSDRIALLLDMGEQEYTLGSAILALFDVSGEPALLDGADVAFDRSTFFAEPARLPVGAGDDLLTTMSTHHNSSQSYAIAAMILVRDNHFELVDTILAFGDRTCAYERTQQLDVRQGPRVPFADIVATVTEQTAPSGRECGDASVPDPGTRTITVTYRWDGTARRYIPDSDASVALRRENEERF